MPLKPTSLAGLYIALSAPCRITRYGDHLGCPLGSLRELPRKGELQTALNRVMGTREQNHECWELKGLHGQTFSIYFHDWSVYVANAPTMYKGFFSLSRELKEAPRWRKAARKTLALDFGGIYDPYGHSDKAIQTEVKARDIAYWTVRLFKQLMDKDASNQHWFRIMESHQNSMLALGSTWLSCIQMDAEHLGYDIKRDPYVNDLCKFALYRAAKVLKQGKGLNLSDILDNGDEDQIAGASVMDAPAQLGTKEVLQLT